MKSSTKWFLGILGGLLLLGFLVAILMYTVMFSLVGSDSDEVSVTGGGKKLGIVELRGPIVWSDEVVGQFKKLRERNDVKAIVFHVDSPGGGVVPSQEIYEEVKKTEAAGTPVVVSMGSVAASGGYYVSCGARRIVANRGSLVGNIGVVSQFLRFDPMLEKVGIEASTIKSGKYKDIGNPLREMTKDDKALLQNLMDDVHRQFIGVVEKGRGLSHEKAVEYADGRVFTGEQALAVGLVDTLGTFEDAKKIAAEIAGIKGEPGIVKERRWRSLAERIFGKLDLSKFLGLREELLQQPILQYRYVHP